MSKSKFIIFLLPLILFSCGEQQDFIGYCTAKVNSEKVIKIDTFGFADKQNKIPYSKETIQPIGSVSKVFIGITLMIASEKEMINLDSDINDYLDFKIINPKVKGENKITLRHLATHTSGIVDDSKIYESSYHEGKEPNLTLEQYLKNVLSTDGKSYSPKSFSKEPAGKRYEYSNIGAALAAYIIEKRAGSLSVLLQKTTFLNLLK